jgi:hypothetical protein
VFYGGQPDPTRFTIDYDVDGRRGTLDGRLGEDGAIAVRVRGGTPP